MHTLTYMLHLAERGTSVRETGRERKRARERKEGREGPLLSKVEGGAAVYWETRSEGQVTEERNR